MKDQSKLATTSILRIGGAMYCKIIGKVLKEEVVDLEQIKVELESSHDEKQFIFDFSKLEDAILPALRVLIQMQAEARKKGLVYVVTPNPEMLLRLKDAGAVRESELYKNKEMLVRALKKMNS
jgi:hypothetical protein